MDAIVYIYIMAKIKVNCKHCGKEELVFKGRAKTYAYCSRHCMSLAFSANTAAPGDKINNWEVTQERLVRKNGRSYVKVRCTCGSNVEKDLPISHLKSKKSKGCSKCSRFHTNTGFNLITGEYWSHLQHGAQSRDLEFSITIEQAWDTYVSQNGKCNLTGVDLEFESFGKDRRSSKTASVDRIDSSKGYVVNNVQWVHKDVNKMKNAFEQEYFLKICKLITEKNGNKI